MDNLIGKRLDGLYEVQELIGSGGMANVYKAVMRGQNGPVPAGTVVAVKVLRREYMHDPDLVRRFKNESKAISLLNHPNIVKVYDVSVNDHLQYIVMEYVDGMTLREYLNERGGKLSSRETVHFISQILKALEHAHANGVVHRDIKPQNIMLLDNGQLRMMDFGIARISRADNQMLAGKAMGSVHYISPEQAKGDETDRTSDIYSVGVMMYEMLSGHLPFDADDVVEVAIKQISDEPRSLHELAPEVPYALVEITEKAMAKLPQNRYPSARAMLEALDTYVQNPSVLFEYQYITEEAPEKVVKRTMNQNRAIRQNEQPAPRKKGKGKPGKKRRTVFLPALFGITIAFALACMALCWMILNDSSNLMNNKADVTLGDYIGMTKDQAMATDQIASGQISPEWEEEYNSNYAAGYIYKQSPVSGRTVREGQSVTLTVSLGTQYVTVPDLTNYVQTDAEQQLKALGVSVLVTQAVDTSVASGAVIRTDPAAGTQVAAGSTVILYISRPQVSTTTKVPSLTGMNVDDARTLLVQNHLGLGSQTEQYSDQPVRYYPVHARGRVFARTWRTFEAAIPLEARVKRYTGEERTLWSLRCLDFGVDFYKNSSIPGDGYDKITTVHQLTLPGGRSLPMMLTAEQYRAYETETVSVDPEAAQAMLEDRLFSYLLEQIGEDGQVIDTSYTARVSEGQLHVTLTAECREEIGVEIPSTREFPGETTAE